MKARHRNAVLHRHSTGLHYSKADHAKLAEVVRDRILELLDN